jgi:hypothetical protein
VDKLNEIVEILNKENIMLKKKAEENEINKIQLETIVQKEISEVEENMPDIPLVQLERIEVSQTAVLIENVTQDIQMLK